MQWKEHAMSETLTIPETSDKTEIYAALMPQVAAVIEGCDDIIANMANVAAILKTAFDFHWVGFYRTTSPDMLMLGPFQGPLACTAISFSRGVCGAAARTQKTIIVADVDAFPGHIACSSLSKSEIVVPLVTASGTQLVLDVDSDRPGDFDAADQKYLEEIVGLLKSRHF